MFMRAFGRPSKVPDPSNEAASSLSGESLYTPNEARPWVFTQRRSGESHDRLGRNIGRFFGIIWLFFVLNIVEFFRSLDFSLAGGILAWTSLVLFIAADVILMLWSNPLWASRSHRDVFINRFLIGIMIVVNIGFVFTFQQENFGYFFIYAAVSSGMFLARRESFRVVVALVGLTYVAGLYSGSSSTDIFTSVLLVGGIGMNTVFWSALMGQNRELRRARAEITRLAVSEERLRFARDLHDLLGHSLSLIALKSELAGRLLESHPNRAALEISDVERVARTALQEVRDAVTGYRTPSLSEELDNANQMLGAAGISTRIKESVVELPVEIDRVLAWFVREGTTNVIRHAEATSVSIAIAQEKNGVYAEMTDNGHPATKNEPASIRTQGGYGLVGLSERIRACDGMLTTGAMPGGGFRLYARIPFPIEHPDGSSEMPPRAEPSDQAPRPELEIAAR